MDWRRMQEEHREWVDREFPGQPLRVPLAGMVEEAGELLHAALKREQLRIWGSDPRYSGEKLDADVVDAVGDCAIYCCSYCNAAEEDFAAAAECTPLELSSSDALSGAAELVRVAAERQVPCMYMRVLRAAAQQLGVDFEGAVSSTWQQVRLRRRSEPAVRTVALVGSSRFKELFHRLGEQLEKGGELVLMMAFFQHADGCSVNREEREVLRRVDRKRLDTADRVVVVDGKAEVCSKCSELCERMQFAGFNTTVSECCRADVLSLPYIGEDTRAELEYARSRGKPIAYTYGDGT